MPFVSSLHLYPIKPCKGIDVESFELDRLGPVGDRRWMIIKDDPNQYFVTQRTHPALAKLEARYLDTATIELSSPGIDSIDVLLSEKSGPSRSVMIWKHKVTARDAGDAVSKWLSVFLDQKVRLVGIDSSYVRFIDEGNSNETKSGRIETGMNIEIL